MFKKLIRKAAEASERPNLAFLLKRRNFFIRLAAVIASGLMVTFSIPPLNWSFLAFFALVPLFLAIYDRKPWVSFGYCFVFGLTWGFTSFYWLREIEPVIPYLIAFPLAAYPAVWALFVPFLTRHILNTPDNLLKGENEAVPPAPSRLQWRKLLLAAVLAAGWCLIEWARSWVLPWNYLSTAMWRTVPLIQICRFTGTYGISFLLVFFNICFAFYLIDPKYNPKTRKFIYPRPLILAGLLIVLFYAEGVTHILRQKRSTAPEVRFNAGLVQGDISQRRSANIGQAQEALDVYSELTQELLESRPAPHVVIWPETAVPYPFRAGNPVSNAFRYRIGQMIGQYKVPFLIGTIDFEDLPPGADYRKQKTYNSAFLLDSDSRLAHVYSKVQRVPWGEYVPFRNFLPAWVIRIIDMDRDLTPGTSLDPVPLLPGVRAGISICFESVFPYVSRGEARRGANLLVVISNDAWYPTSNEPAQHLANAVFRSVETGLPQLRCGNNSTGCLIEPSGYISDCLFKERDEKTGLLLPQPIRRGRTTGVIPVKVQEKPDYSPFVRYGNVFIIFCWLLVLGGFATAFSNWETVKSGRLAMFIKTGRKK